MIWKLYVGEWSLLTDDPLGIGGLLSDATRIITVNE